MYKLALTILLITGIFTLTLPSRPAAAARGTVDLVMGGEGATPWNIVDIKPGDIGLKTVTLQNTGTADGTVTIWLSDVLNAEGVSPEPETGDPDVPGELGDQLLLGVSTSGLRSNLHLPAPINSFPQSVSSHNYVRINNLGAGESKTLIWEWSLPALTGNEVQGDVVTFTINYLLEEVVPEEGGGDPGPEPAPAPSPGPAGTPTANEPVITTTDGQTATMLISQPENIDTSSVFTVLENKVSLSFEKGTSIVCDNGEILSELEIKETDITLPLPEGLVTLSPLYSIEAFTTSGIMSRVSINPPINLTLDYDTDILPEGDYDIFLAYWDEENEAWVQLEQPEGFIASEGKAAARISHFTLFTVIARAVPKAPEPARFRLSGLSVSPPQMKAGENTVITVNVANVGGLSGEYTLKIDVKDLLQTSRMLRIAPGEERVVRIEVTAPAPGVYEVVIGNQRGYFTVEGTQGTTQPKPIAHQWIYLLAITIPVLMVGFIFLKEKQLKRRNHN